jgi:hypothetical protein
MNNVDLFFSLLQAVYGADTISRKWPTDLDKQLIKKLKEAQINALTHEEIRGAIDNASREKGKGNEEFLFLDIDLILTGAKRIGHPSHKSFAALPEPRMNVTQRKAALTKLREETGL